MNIGDLMLGIYGDFAEFKKQATTEGKKAGDASSKSFAEGFKDKAVKAVGLALAGAFALGAKGAMEMERAQGDFQAATGRSREEAVAFSKDMNGLVGNAATVGRSFEEITAAGIQVAQQFKLTGEDGKQLTQDFLAFAKVTRQDAAAAVDSFDAALDAFGEPAARASSLMDQLVASNQEYGTDAGPAALAALQGMAPALEAMGMGLDEGVGLLNLFESAGIDAGSANAALTKSLAKLKPGEDLNDLIARIGAIEDPLERAAAAAEIFGQKGGARLANAIKPGMTSLDEFGISIEDAAGSSEQAAEDMLTTSDKVKMYAKRIGSALRGLGGEFGPVLMGFSSLGTLVGPALMKMLAPVVGSGTALGTAFGRAFSIAAAAAVVVGGAAIFAAAMNTRQLLDSAFMDATNQLDQQGAEALRKAVGALAAEAHVGIDKVEQVVRDRMANLGESWQDAWAAVQAGGVQGIQDALDPVQAYWNARLAAMAGEAQFHATRAAEGWTGGIVSSGSWGEAADAAEAAAAAVLAELNIRAAVYAEAKTLALNLRDGILSGKQAVKDGMAKLRWIMKHPDADQNYLNWLEGRLTGKKLTEGLASTDETVRLAAEEQRDLITAEINKVKGISLGARIGNDIASGLASKYGTVSAAASIIADSIWGNLRTGSPAREGPLSKEGGPEGWAKKSAADYAKGWRDVLSFGTGLGLTAMPAFAGSLGSSSVGLGEGSVNHSGTVRHLHELSGETAQNLKAAGFDDQAVAKFMRNMDRENDLPVENR